jgi:uncharacterized membrane protein
LIPNLTLAGAIHTVLALSGIVVGLVQLLRPKRGAGHRARGYAFVYAMLIADGTAMLIFQFTGKFNILHAGAIVNLVCVVLGVVPVLRSPRRANWKNQHYYFIAWSYVGLLAAAATELVVRTVHLATRGQAWTVTAFVSIVVTAIGYVLIERYRPGSESKPVSGAAIQHDGVPS